MGECRFDHSVEDVHKKLEEQAHYLPADIHQAVLSYLKQPATQTQLNELFHLLKKYDLAEEAVRQERNVQFRQLLQGFTA